MQIPPQPICPANCGTSYTTFLQNHNSHNILHAILPNQFIIIILTNRNLNDASSPEPPSSSTTPQKRQFFRKMPNSLRAYRNLIQRQAMWMKSFFAAMASKKVRCPRLEVQVWADSYRPQARSSRKRIGSQSFPRSSIKKRLAASNSQRNHQLPIFKWTIVNYSLLIIHYPGNYSRRLDSGFGWQRWRA